MEKLYYIKKMEIFMMEIGRTINLKDMVFFNKIMVKDQRGIGKTIIQKDLVKVYLKMMKNMKVNGN